MALSACSVLVFSFLGRFPVPYFLVLSDTSCEPAEEGTSYNITVNFNHRDFHYFSKIGRFFWSLARDNRTDRAARCYFRGRGRGRGRCRPDISGIEAIFSFNTSILTFTNVSRSEIPNIETTWMYDLHSPFDHQSFNVCEPLEVYAKPLNPTCDPPQLDTSTDQISVTCVTEKVYPTAGCQFLYSKDNVHFQELQGKITYNHTAVSENVVYYKSQCTFSASAAIPEIEDNYFKVNMYPKLNISQQRFYVQSNIVQINPGFTVSDISMTTDGGDNKDRTLVIALGFTVSDSSMTTDGDDNKDRTLVIALGVAVAVVAVAAVVFAMMWWRSRSKLKSQQTRPAAQDDAVPSPEIPAGYNKTEFVAVADDGYEMVRTPAGGESPKAVQESHYEDVASEAADGPQEESLYANAT